MPSRRPRPVNSQHPPSSTTFRHRLGWVAYPPFHEPPREALTEPPATMESSLGACPTPAARESDRKASSDEESDFAAKRRSQWARLIARTYLADPERCPSCGEPMKIIAALVSPHQDGEIERILRCVGKWYPPWKRERAGAPALRGTEIGSILEPRTP
jgi:hypothetical protein